MNYLKFSSWKNSHSTEMRKLAFAHPDDVFIFTRFSGHLPFEFDGKQILFAKSIEEAIGYIRHIFIYDILNDVINELEVDINPQFYEQQKDAVLLLDFWFKSAKIATSHKKDQKLSEFCGEFNVEFSNRKTTEYEIQVLYCADDLRDFLIRRYSGYEIFNERQLYNICSKRSFDGKLLNDYIYKLFR